MLFLRSLLFNIAFYVNLIFWMIAALPALAMPHRWFMRIPHAWALSSLWLLRVIAGIGVEYRGLEQIPAGGLLVAAKHQSLWETFALLPLFEDPTFILKRELMWIPVFGWHIWKVGCIPIDRKKGSQALAQMTEQAKIQASHGRQILIFPEGTRRPPGAPPAYKYGIAHLYQSLGVSCLPVALNSGLYWPRRQFIRRPGTIIVEILEPIAPGWTRDELLRTVQERIEIASNRLLAEARSDRDPDTVIPATTLNRL